ncbi:MAG: hypothetical protein ABF673_00970 [Acetobacter persici]
MSRRIPRKVIMTAWVERCGRIEFRPGVGFPDGALPLCCGTQEAIRSALKKRACNGRNYAVPGMSEAMSDQRAFECMERLRVNLVGQSSDLVSYFSGMNGRDV